MLNLNPSCCCHFHAFSVVKRWQERSYFLACLALPGTMWPFIRYLRLLPGAWLVLQQREPTCQSASSDTLWFECMCWVWVTEVLWLSFLCSWWPRSLTFIFKLKQCPFVALAHDNRRTHQTIKLVILYFSSPTESQLPFFVYIFCVKSQIT